MHAMSDTCPGSLICAYRKNHTHSAPTNNILCVNSVGADECSCTTTVAALAFWLCPPANGGPARTLQELASEASEAQRVGLDELVRGDEAGGAAKLLVFSTPSHKFAVLVVDDQAALLQSNQDDTRGGHKFTLAEWLKKDIKVWSLAQLGVFMRELTDAATGLTGHEDFCARYFRGARFKRGNPSEYWAVSLPVSVRHDAAAVVEGGAE